ncbi:MAG: leucine-rich repeat domain-containing protein [Lachnospiraceae bacterium]|nr:leucine-rich repeat domain-containing protein [Lachnospiraceae bacterium]
MKVLRRKVMAVTLVLAIVMGFLAVPAGSSNDMETAYAKTPSVTVDNAKKGMKVTVGKYVYKITKLSKKNSTLEVVGLTPAGNKKLKKISIQRSIKIKSKKGKNKGAYTYKVTSIAKNAFKGNKKIVNVNIGENVESIGKNAFANCSKLKKVKLSKSLKNIKEAAFLNDKKLEQVVIPKDSELQTIDKNAFKNCKKLTKIDIENATKLKKVDKTAFDNTKVDKDKLKDIIEITELNKYSYEIIPFVEPFNDYFFIKTDNPNPDTFCFVDNSSVYAGEGKTGSITPVDTEFSDVIYENKETKRVKGGYIAVGSSTDGGELTLQIREAKGSTSVYNISTGTTSAQKRYQYQDTKITVKIAKVQNVVDYLITTYGDNKKSYFENMDAIQKGFSQVCLYSGAYVLGEQTKSTKSPYFGLSTSPHVDQIYYIQSPYSRKGNKSLLCSAIHPMRYDSIGFPSVMSSVAKKLNSAATVKWSDSAHYIVNVTLDGVTKSYGGQGNGKGQGIYANQIKYWYKFDGSNDDAYKTRSLKEVADMILDYGKMTVPEEPIDQEKLTWASVRKTVGKDGAYVKLILLTSIFGGSGTGYTFMYDNGSTSEGSQGWGSVGHFYNAWYDGRYYNKWEYYYPGATLEKTVEDVQPSLIFKDVKIKIPDDGKSYLYNYSSIDKATNYNKETGVWSGFTTFNYDKESKTWKASILNSITYRADNKYNKIEDQDFVDTCTITMDEAKEMEIDKNTNTEPECYYIYDMVTPPGTYHSGK